MTPKVDSYVVHIKLTHVPNRRGLVGTEAKFITVSLLPQTGVLYIDSREELQIEFSEYSQIKTETERLLIIGRYSIILGEVDYVL